MILYAIPFFFALIGIEGLVSRSKGKSVYLFNDTLSNLSCGVLQQLTGLFIRVIPFGAFVFVYNNYKLMDMKDWSPWAIWVVGFILVDLFYYWFHRLSHEINFLWAAHIVHHQSEQYNLSVALRQSLVQPFFSGFFYLPLAVMGLPPTIFIGLTALNALYQFWIHTKLIDQLGFLEKILVTPSHHRVHHGSNKQYLDRNHGGTFIIWDKMFGTFEAESETVRYGITNPLKNWNPYWANFHFWEEIWAASKKMGLKSFFVGPDQLPQGELRVQSPPPEPIKKRKGLIVILYTLLIFSTVLILSLKAHWIFTALIGLGLLGVNQLSIKR